MKKLLYILVILPLCFASSCEEDCEYAAQGFDCEGAVTAQIGDVMEGGYLFYIDETGEHGLVTAMEDFTEGASDPSRQVFDGYEWGCYEVNVSGSDGQAIGTGYQNAIDIVAQNCQPEYGVITAAQVSFDATKDGYTDWYLPSRYELVEMYNTIGSGSELGNIGGFETNYWKPYWSSSEYFSRSAWSVSFNNGNSGYTDKYYPRLVRAVRAF